MTLLDTEAIAQDRSDRVMDCLLTTPVNRCRNGIFERCSLNLLLDKSSMYVKPSGFWSHRAMRMPNENRRWDDVLDGEFERVWHQRCK